jgi:hypothetical protein
VTWHSSRQGVAEATITFSEDIPAGEGELVRSDGVDIVHTPIELGASEHRPADDAGRGDFKAHARRTVRPTPQPALPEAIADSKRDSCVHLYFRDGTCPAAHGCLSGATSAAWGPNVCDSHSGASARPPG